MPIRLLFKNETEIEGKEREKLANEGETTNYRLNNYELQGGWVT